MQEAWKEKQPEEIEQWRQKGTLARASTVDPTRTGYLKWKMWDEFTTQALFDNAKHLTMPIHIVTGTNDATTPLEHVERFYQMIPEPKTLTLIADADHSYSQPVFRQGLGNAIISILNKTKKSPQ